MIVDALYAFLAGILDAVLLILPNWTFHAPPEAYLAYASFQKWDKLAPVHELLQIMTLTLSMVTALWLYKWIIKFIDWVADILP